jgi:predicted  nucleic acid-binding Zn-ribbon protein
VATDIWAALDQSNKDRDKQINDLKTEISKLYVQLDNTNKRLDAAEKKLAEQTPPGSLDGLYEIKKKG